MSVWIKSHFLNHLETYAFTEQRQYLCDTITEGSVQVLWLKTGERIERKINNKENNGKAKVTDLHTSYRIDLIINRIYSFPAIEYPSYLNGSCH